MTLRAPRFFVSLAGLCLSHGAALAGGIIDQEVEQNHAVPETVKLTVRNTDGRIYIYGSEEPQIQIKALKRAFTQERVDAIKIDVKISGDTATIDTIYPPPPAGGITADRSGTVDYSIIVPQNCTVTKVELTNGEVLVEGIRGAGINAHVGNGKLLLRQCFTPTEASIGQGSIDLFYGWWEKDIPFSVNAEVADGDLRLALPRKGAAQLYAITDSGHISNRFDPEEKGDEDMQELNATVGKPDGLATTAMKLHTANGNIFINRAY